MNRTNNIDGKSNIRFKMRESYISLNFLMLIVFTMLILPYASQAAPILISVSSGGAQADKGSYRPSISDDGRYVAFQSNATNLVPNDNNGFSDIFVRDLVNSVTERVSIQTDGTEFNAHSFYPSISDNGNLVVMQSYTGPLAFGNQYAKVLVYDRVNKILFRVLPPVNDTTPYDRGDRLRPRMAGNGRFVAFYSYMPLYEGTLPVSARPPGGDTNRSSDVFVYDLQANLTDRVTHDSNGLLSNGDSFLPSLSDDGNMVAFYSYANNLVPGDLNAREDCFVKNRTTRSLIRINVDNNSNEANGPCQEPVISGNGRFVVFSSSASNLVSGDTNNAWDIFVYDLNTNVIARVSLSSEGIQANASSYAPDISDDGRFVVFQSKASNLVNDDKNGYFDIFLHDRQTGTTVRLSVPSSGEANGHSYNPVISGDGRFIAFESLANNLVQNDTNNESDIFVVKNPLLP